MIILLLLARLQMFLLMLLMLSASCSHQTQPVTLTMTKIKVVTVPASMLPRPKQVESSDLKIGSCVDELAPALRAEIDKANGDSDKIIKWQQNEIKRYESEEKAP